MFFFFGLLLLSRNRQFRHKTQHNHRRGRMDEMTRTETNSEDCWKCHVWFGTTVSTLPPLAVTNLHVYNCKQQDWIELSVFTKWYIYIQVVLMSHEHSLCGNELKPVHSHLMFGPNHSYCPSHVWPSMNQFFLLEFKRYKHTVLARDTVHKAPDTIFLGVPFL